jgi:hypothetical protein
MDSHIRMMKRQQTSIEGHLLDAWKQLHKLYKQVYNYDNSISEEVWSYIECHEVLKGEDQINQDDFTLDLSKLENADSISDLFTPCVCDDDQNLEDS